MICLFLTVVFIMSIARKLHLPFFSLTKISFQPLSFGLIPSFDIQKENSIFLVNSMRMVIVSLSLYLKRTNNILH